MTTRAKFTGLAVHLKAAFVKRDPHIDAMLAALVAGQHVLLLGEPGTAKSALAACLCGSITGGDFFQWLLTKASPPEELLGPLSLKGLEADEYRRVTAGKLPEAHVAFLDEVFKSNSTLLNALLSILNERLFFNGPKPTPVPLLMAVGASNETPTDAELGALYDRFLVKFWLEDASGEDIVAMLSSREPRPLPGALTVTDVEAARTEAAQVQFSRAALEQLVAVRAELARAGYRISPRAWRQASRYLRAVAWLDGKAEVDGEVMEALKDCVWKDPTHRHQVAGIIARVANPASAEAQELADSASDIFKASERKKDEDPGRWAIRVGGSLQELNKVLQRLNAIKRESPSKAVDRHLATVSAAARGLKTEALKSAGLGG